MKIEMSDLGKRNTSSPAVAPDYLEFEDSRLGTKEYWDQFYDTELANFEDTGDEGEIWFGRSAELRILKFVLERVPITARICDLGTGNGSLLRRLRDRGYSNLCGLDYSAKAVELAKRASSPSRLAEEHDRLQPTDSGVAATTMKINWTIPIEFHVANLTAEKLDANLMGRFDILLDKGTFDAISLATDRRRQLQLYQQNICLLFRSTDELDDDLELLGTKEAAASMVRRRQKRLFIIVSCNFTKDELLDLLETECLRFEVELPATNSIQFGGKKGSTCTGLVFRWIPDGFVDDK